MLAECGGSAEAGDGGGDGNWWKDVGVPAICTAHVCVVCTRYFCIEILNQILEPQIYLKR